MLDVTPGTVFPKILILSRCALEKNGPVQVLYFLMWAVQVLVQVPYPVAAGPGTAPPEMAGPGAALFWRLRQIFFCEIHFLKDKFLTIL